MYCSVTTLYLVIILKFYIVPVCLLFKINTFMQTHVIFFYGENMTSFLNYVTATLRALFA